MAQSKSSVTFKNATIDASEMTITEVAKEEMKVYNLNDILADWDGKEGVTITIQQTNEIPPVEED